MKKCMLIGLICLLSSQWMWGQHFPQMDARNYVSDTALFIPRRPWLAASEVFGMNMAVWTFDRFLMNEDFAKINGHTIKQNFKTGPVWDTDKFSTNLVAHPYHGSLYFNAARSNGLNFWQSIPFAAGGSLMWEFFMETEPPSINDMLATSFGGIELGEITYRLSDLFIDNRSHGAERVGREILSGLISPMRAINRIITGEAWRHSSSKGRVYTSVPVNFIVGVGPRFLAEQMPGYGLYLCNLQRFFKRHIRQNAVQRLGQHGLSCAWRPYQQDVMSTSRCNFHGPFGALLSFDLCKVSIAIG